jgi:hypothetical protein
LVYTLPPVAATVVLGDVTLLGRVVAGWWCVRDEAADATGTTTVEPQWSSEAARKRRRRDEDAAAMVW